MKTLFAAIALAWMSLQAPIPAFAASGIAYDSVMKFTQSAPSEPGDFAAEFKSATQPASSNGGKGGLLGNLGAAMGAAQAMGAMFSRGIAERYAILGSKIRTETPALNMATITDCKARTLTRLDLAKKTYNVTSLDSDEKDDSPSSRGSSKSGGKNASPPDARYDVTVVNKALGPKTVSNLPANGFDSDMTMKATENGSTQTTQMNMLSYLSSYAEPPTTCAAPGESGMPDMTMMRTMVAAMTAAVRDPHFTFHASGPEMPRGKLALYTTMTAKGGAGGQQGQFVIVQQRGNVRALADSDAEMFAIPAGFTKVKAE